MVVHILPGKGRLNDEDLSLKRIWGLWKKLKYPIWRREEKLGTTIQYAWQFGNESITS